MNLYLISGLGADKRIFQKLVFPEGYIVHHIEWVEPITGEPIADYCSRLLPQIDHTKPFSLIGVSFGGMVAIELAKQINPVQTIIISSITGPSEVGGVYIFLGKLRVHKLLPLKFFLSPSSTIFRLFGAHTAEEKSLLTEILRDTNPGFFRWAIGAIFTWENDFKPIGLVHIHGTADKILPYHKTMQAIKVAGGEHLMVYSKAEIVSDLLKDVLHLLSIHPY